MLNAENVTVRYGAQTVVNGLSFELRAGQWLMLVGPNGAGKSTLIEAIAQGGFIAQAVVPPSERTLHVDGVEQRLKLDLRNFVYRDGVQLVSARLYQGQTTNFRTPGGGFAAVFSVGCRDQAAT